MGHLALLFPGQGSQSVGMGRALCDDSPAARLIFDEADDVLGFSLTRLCFEAPRKSSSSPRTPSPRS